MPSAEAVNAALAALGVLVPDVPDHHAELGAGYAEQRSQVPVTLPPVLGTGRQVAKHPAGCGES